jgi:hypothetical protein
MFFSAKNNRDRIHYLKSLYENIKLSAILPTLRHRAATELELNFTFKIFL